MTGHMRFGIATALVAAVVLVLGGEAARSLGGFLLVVGIAVVVVNLMRDA